MSSNKELVHRVIHLYLVQYTYPISPEPRSTISNVHSFNRYYLDACLTHELQRGKRLFVARQQQAGNLMSLDTYFLSACLLIFREIYVCELVV